jgi:hypothetical protein
VGTEEEGEEEVSCVGCMGWVGGHIVGRGWENNILAWSWSIWEHLLVLAS